MKSLVQNHTARMCLSNDSNPDPHGPGGGTPLPTGANQGHISGDLTGEEVSEQKAEIFRL